MSHYYILAEGLHYYEKGLLTNRHVVFEGPQLENLKTILHRALNTWPDGPPELFDLDQLLNHGQILVPHRKG